MDNGTDDELWAWQCQATVRGQAALGSSGRMGRGTEREADSRSGHCMRVVLVVRRQDLILGDGTGGSLLIDWIEEGEG